MERSDLLDLYLRGEMERKGIGNNYFCRCSHFSDWYDSCDTRSLLYGDCSSLAGWKHRGDLLSLRRIFGSFSSKKIFQGTERMKLILEGGKELKIGFREQNRYIQLCRENEYSAFYYDIAEEKLLRYKKESKFSFSLKYQLCILAALYLGYLLNDKAYILLAQNRYLKYFLVFFCFSIGGICLLFFENNITRILKKDGVEVPYPLSDELQQKGQKDFKTQKTIMYLWSFISAILCFAFYITNSILLLVLFLASMIALSSMVAIARPVLRENLYQYLKKRM